MGKLRARESLGDGLIDSSAISGQNPNLAVFINDFEVVSPELDQLRRGTGDQRLSDEGRRQFPVAKRGLVRPLEIGGFLLVRGNLATVDRLTRLQDLGEF